MTDQGKHSIKLSQTPLGKVLKNILLTMFGVPASLTALERLQETLMLSDWLQHIIQYMADVSHRTWNFLIPFVEISERVSGMLTVLCILALPVVFQYLKLRALGREQPKFIFEGPDFSRLNFEEKANYVQSFVGLMFIVFTLNLFFLFVQSAFMILGQVVLFIVQFFILPGVAVALISVFYAGVGVKLVRWGIIMVGVAIAALPFIFALYSLFSGGVVFQMLVASIIGTLSFGFVCVVFLLWQFNNAYKVYTPKYIFWATMGIYALDYISRIELPAPPSV